MKKIILYALAFTLLWATKEDITLLNNYRKSAGLIPFTHNAILEKTAINHADYLVANKSLGHYQKSGNTLFTGERVTQRAGHAGYESTQVAENISYGQQDTKASLEELFSGIYHRFGFLNFKYDEIGIGIKGKDKEIHYVYNLGNSVLNEMCKNAQPQSTGWQVCQDKTKKIKENYQKGFDVIKAKNPAIVIFPTDKSKEVNPVFYRESPMPLPGSKVSGTPISIQFNDHYFSSVKVKTIALRDDNNQLLEGKLLDKTTDPNKKFNDFQFAFFPTIRLDFGKTYKLSIDYDAEPKETYSGENKNNITASFTTRSLPQGKLYVLNDFKSGENIPVKNGASYTIYARPTSNQDVPFSKGMDHIKEQDITNKTITIVDDNTLTLKATGAVGGILSYKLTTNNHLLNFVIANEDKAQAPKTQEENKKENKGKIKEDTTPNEKKKATIDYKKGWNLLATPIDKAITKESSQDTYTLSELGEGKFIYVLKGGKFQNNPQRIEVGEGFMLYAPKDGKSQSLEGMTYGFRGEVKKGWNFFGVSKAMKSPKERLGLSDNDKIFVYRQGAYQMNPDEIEAKEGFFVVKY